MLLRKSVPVLLGARNLLQRKALNEFKPAIRHSSQEWAYRKNTPPNPKYIEWLASAAGGLAWWWIFWHLWTEPEHVLGEFPYPDPSKWTDAELGIPEK